MIWKFTILLCLFMSSNLCADIKVLAFAGSNRSESLNKQLVLEASALARQMGADVEFIDLKDFEIPFYDGDLEAAEGMPQKVKAFRQLMVQSSVIMIASPEYNGSLSGMLKNALDWASRSEQGGGSREAFKGKKFVVMSAAPGAGGGSRGLGHLRTIIENIGGSVIPAQFILPHANKAFDDQGHLKDEKQADDLKRIIQSIL